MSEDLTSKQMAHVQASITMNGRKELFMSCLTQFQALAGMGHYSSSDDVRNKAHAELDLYFDAILHGNRLAREIGGLE
jgi:hypothetical protein